MRRIETASLHRGIAGSQHSFLPVPPGSNKMQQLLQVPCCSTVRRCLHASGALPACKRLLLHRHRMLLCDRPCLQAL